MPQQKRRMINRKLKSDLQNEITADLNELTPRSNTQETHTHECNHELCNPCVQAWHDKKNSSMLTEKHFNWLNTLRCIMMTMASLRAQFAARCTH